MSAAGSPPVGSAKGVDAVLTPQTALLRDLLQRYRAGYGLPQRFYLEPELYPLELDAIWRRGWLFAGHACEIPAPGDYFTFDFDTDSVIVVRQPTGEIGAFHNVCRHRGSVIVAEPRGSRRSFVCPYHQWTYDLDGSLQQCRKMPAEIDRSALGLRPVHVRNLEGLIYLSFAQDPPDFAAAEALIAPMARPQGFERARVAASIDYDIPANWKLVWENNRECYHCDAMHPQYVKANFDRYDADDLSEEIERRIALATARSEAKWAACGLVVTHRDVGLAQFPDREGKIWCSASRTALVEGYVTESMDGKRVAPLMGEYRDDVDVGTLRLRTLPNFWCHASCDHAVTTRLVPAGPRLTKARVAWLVEAAAEEGRDYDRSRLMPFWQLTSEQDWLICERQQRGVESRAYVPGPLSPTKEYNVENFIRWYLRRLAGAARLDAPVLSS